LLLNTVLTETQTCRLAARLQVVVEGRY